MPGIGAAMMGDGGMAEPQADPRQPAMGGEQDGAPQPNVSPEEQAFYDEFIGNAEMLMFPDGEGGKPTTAPIILSQLQGQFDPEIAELFAKADPPIGQTPNDNLAVTAVSIILMLESSMGQQVAIPKDTMDAALLQGGAEILQMLAEVSEASGIKEYSEQEIETAVYRSVDLYRVSSANVDQEELAREFEQIVAADRDGTLAEKMPGLKPALDRASQAEQQPEQQAQQPQSAGRA